MTICNMSIEAGARAGMIAPDDVTFAYLEGRPGVPAGAAWEQAVEAWRDAAHRRRRRRSTARSSSTSRRLKPQVTWGTNPGMVAPVDGVVPDPADFADPAQREAVERALAYMDLAPGTPLVDIRIDKVFIGSCTNARIEDLRVAATVVSGKQVADRVQAIVVPGSAQVKRQAEEEGLHEIFEAAGFEWRRAGLLDVPRDEPRRARAGRALRVDVEPQLRGAAGRRRAHAPRQPGDGGRRGGRRSLRRRAGCSQ